MSHPFKKRAVKWCIALVATTVGATSFFFLLFKLQFGQSTLRNSFDEEIFFKDIAASEFNRTIAFFSEFVPIHQQQLSLNFTLEGNGSIRSDLVDELIRFPGNDSKKFVKLSISGARYFGKKRNNVRNISSSTSTVANGVLNLREIFRTAMTPCEHRMYVSVLRACVSLLETSGATFFLYAGSLIGWYRHGYSVIPWDDDVDLALLPTFPEAERNLSFYRVMFQRKANDYVFQQIFGNLTITVQDGIKLKCFSESPEFSYAIDGVSWRWPFIDIHFMHVYSASTWERVYDPVSIKLGDVVVEDPFDPKFQYPLNWIFPLRRGRFESVGVYLPREVGKVLNKTYDLSQCEAMWYNHRKEEVAVQWSKVTRVNCSQLTDFVKFTKI